MLPHGGTLTVSTRVVTPDDAEGRRGPLFQKFEPTQTLIVAEVQDTGTGIKKEHLGKLFFPFFSAKPPGEGNGLGLFVAKRIIALHGGAIDLKNAPERGALATVIFKASREESS